MASPNWLACVRPRGPCAACRTALLATRPAARQQSHPRALSHVPCRRSAVLPEFRPRSSPSSLVPGSQSIKTHVKPRRPLQIRRFSPRARGTHIKPDHHPSLHILLLLQEETIKLRLGDETEPAPITNPSLPSLCLTAWLLTPPDHDCWDTGPALRDGNFSLQTSPGPPGHRHSSRGYGE